MGKCMHGLHSLLPIYRSSPPLKAINSVLFQWVCVWMTWLSVISLPFLHVWVRSWLDTCVLSAAGGGEVESVGGRSSILKVSQEPLSHSLVVPSRCHQLGEEPGQQAQARQLKVNEISSALGISHTRHRQRLWGAQKSWDSWINRPGNGCGQERLESAPKAQIYPREHP